MLNQKIVLLDGAGAGDKDLSPILDILINELRSSGATVQTFSLEHLSTHPQASPKRLFAIANNGFPEAYQNGLALAICQRFAIDTGMIWLGGLAMGAGEALFGGQPIKGTEREGGPPVKHVIQALDIASASLANGQMIPPKAAKLMAKTPIPFIPFRLWRRMFITIAEQNWRKRAAVNQVGEEELLAQPYARVRLCLPIIRIYLS